MVGNPEQAPGLLAVRGEQVLPGPDGRLPLLPLPASLDPRVFQEGEQGLELPELLLVVPGEPVLQVLGLLGQGRDILDELGDPTLSVLGSTTIPNLFI